jgi:hypothetical protein
MPTAEERLAIVQSKVERAKKHIEHLNTEIGAFFASNPYEVGTKRDPQTRKLIYYVSRANPVPIAISAITGDVIQNLRTALDYLHQQLLMVGTNSAVPSKGKDATFYIDGDPNQPKHYETSLPAKVQGLRQDAIDALLALEPYKGGKGHDLWVLNTLNNIDKHRLLVTVGSAYQSVNLGAHVSAMMRKTFGDHIPILDAFFRPADTKCPLKAGDELFIDAPDAEPQQHLNFRFNISLNEPEIGEPKPLLETIQHLADLVGNTVASFRSCLA